MGLFTKKNVSAGLKLFDQEPKTLGRQNPQPAQETEDASAGRSATASNQLVQGKDKKKAVQAIYPKSKDHLGAAFTRKESARSIALSSAAFVGSDGNVNQAQALSVELSKQIARNIQEKNNQVQKQHNESLAMRADAQTAAAKSAAVQQSKLGNNEVWPLYHHMPISLDNIKNEWPAFVSIGATPALMNKLHEIWQKEKPSMEGLAPGQRNLKGTQLADLLFVEARFHSVPLPFRYNYLEATGTHELLAMPPLSRAQYDLGRQALDKMYHREPHKVANQAHLSTDVIEVPEDAPFPAYTKDMHMRLEHVRQNQFIFHELGVSGEMMEFWASKISVFMKQDKARGVTKWEDRRANWEEYAEMINRSHRDDSIPLSVRVEQDRTRHSVFELIWTPTLTRADTRAAALLLDKIAESSV